MVFEHSKHLIAQFLIEAWCLEIVGVEGHVLTPTGSRFLLCCLEESCPNPLSPEALALSSRFAGRTPLISRPDVTAAGASTSAATQAPLVDKSLTGVATLEPVIVELQVPEPV